jgi:hypothetical protein
MVNMSKFPFVIDGSTSELAAGAAWSSQTGETAGHPCIEPLFQENTE